MFYRMKKVYLFIGIIMVLSLWGEIPDFIESLRARGMTEANYGSVVFPILIGFCAFYKYKISK